MNNPHSSKPFFVYFGKDFYVMLYIVILSSSCMK